MNSLRARIAILLVLSIICVVALATATTFFVLRGLEDRNNNARAAEEVRLLIGLVGAIEHNIPPPLERAPVAGAPLDSQTHRVKTLFTRLGMDNDVVITQPPNDSRAMVSIKLKDGWLAIPMPTRGPPPGAWIATTFWIGLIGLGTLVVALGLSRRLTRHLAMLENVALLVDSKGTLPRLPETGPAELKATARALNTMTNRLKTAVESRMRLVAAAGHDLRTPMTRMRLRAEFLEETERKMWLDDLEELDRIADSAIQLVREEAQAETEKPLRLDDVTTKVCGELNDLKMPVSLLHAEEVWASCAPLALTRALRNLIINAATHGHRAFIHVGPRGNKAVITIDDEGPGIPQEIMPRVFEPFFRVDPSRRQSLPGAGLGLAIAKEIIERHGGQLTLANRSTGGLRQEVTFSIVARSSSFGLKLCSAKVSSERYAAPV